MNADAAPESVLVVRLGAMGDVIHAIPAIAAMRGVFPELRIGWVIEKRWAELLCLPGAPVAGPRNANRPLVDFVHVVDTKLWRKSLLSRDTRKQLFGALTEVRREKYEVATDFQGAIKSAVVAKFAGAQKVIGMARPRETPAKALYDERVQTQGTHVIDQFHSLAEAVIGTRAPIADAIFPSHSEDAKIKNRLNIPDGEFVMLNPGAGWGAKQWPPERYGEVANALAQHGLKPLLNYGPGEEELASIVFKHSGETATPICCTITELIALTRHAHLFIGGDTGPLHLAAALHIPVVAIFGPTDPARNGPYGTRSIVLRNAESRTSHSHTRAPDAGLLKITSEEVIAAARKLLESPRG